MLPCFLYPPSVKRKLSSTDAHYKHFAQNSFYALLTYVLIPVLLIAGFFIDPDFASYSEKKYSVSEICS